MARSSNARPHFINARDTAALAQAGCQIIDSLCSTYGLGVEIPTMQDKVLVGLMTHPLWVPTGSWVNFPSHCEDHIGKHRGLWPIIRGVYPFFKEWGSPRAILWIPDPKTKRPTGKWMVTDRLDLMWATINLTFSDSRSRFNNDMEALAQILGLHEDVISVAMTEGTAAMWDLGQVLINESIKHSDYIRDHDPAVVKTHYGWKSVRDAIQAFQRSVNVSNTGTMAVGEALWDMYVDKLASGGLVP